jgi:NAD(P)-dependent dehydrogenase (short-subunit alcohol dehydrogenase family)
MAENGVCVIVGAGPGMGLAIARRFGKEGYRLALVSRKADNLVKDIRKLGDLTAHGFPADASDAKALAGAFENIRNLLAAPDVLVYNAAAIEAGKPSELTAETMLQNFRVNVVGALLSAQAVIPHMKAQRRGTILFTGGGLALNPHPSYASLAAWIVAATILRTFRSVIRGIRPGRGASF